MFRKISKGDTVAVVAPASAAPDTTMEAGIHLLEAYFEVVTYRERPWAQQGEPPLPYLRGSDEKRAWELGRALADARVRAIFCARGGYGTMRLLTRLDPELVRERQIPIVGFSDITALHALWAQQGAPSIHGPVVNQLATVAVSDREQLFSLLMAHDLPAIDGLESWTGGTAAGSLFAANLAMLAALSGTPFFPALKGCLLLLEDVGEAPYRIDRQLTQLQLAGAFDGLAGIIIGDFMDCDRAQGTPPAPCTASDVLRERLTALGLPLAAGAPVGHGFRNLPLPLGVNYRLDSEAGTLQPQ